MLWYIYYFNIKHINTHQHEYGNSCTSPHICSPSHVHHMHGPHHLHCRIILSNFGHPVSTISIEAHRICYAQSTQSHNKIILFLTLVWIWALNFFPHWKTIHEAKHSSHKKLWSKKPYDKYILTSTSFVLRFACISVVLFRPRNDCWNIFIHFIIRVVFKSRHISTQAGSNFAIMI